MISFTTNVKNEVSTYNGNKSENIAELSAIMRNNAKYNASKIEIVTENSKVAKRIYLLLKDIMHLKEIIYMLLMLQIK